jgi:hypothetical protein
MSIAPEFRAEMHVKMFVDRAADNNFDLARLDRVVLVLDGHDRKSSYELYQAVMASLPAIQVLEVRTTVPRLCGSLLRSRRQNSGARTCTSTRHRSLVCELACVQAVSRRG